jgi:hypothetical protein
MIPITGIQELTGIIISTLMAQMSSLPTQGLM